MVLWQSWRPVSDKAMSKARAWRAGCGYEYGSKSLVACTYVISKLRPPPLFDAIRLALITELFIISEIACIIY